MRTASAAVLTLVLAAVAAAQGRVVPYPVFESRGFQNALDAGTRTREGVPGPEAWTQYTRYRIRAELDPETARLQGQATLEYENRSPRTLRRLWIHLRQNLYRAGALRNRRTEDTGGMEISNVRAGGEELDEGRRGWWVRGTRMGLRLTEPLEPGAVAEVSMDFAFRVPARSGSFRMGHEDNHVFYLGYWYPQMAVLDDVSGWVVDPYLGRGEFYMGYGDYDVELTVPHGWIVRATGELINPGEVLSEQTLARLEQARGSREVVHVVGPDDRGAGRATKRSQEGTLTWRFQADNVRDFAVSVSDRYLWDATHARVAGPAEDGSGERVAMIHAVYEPEAETWKRAAEFARHAIEYMSETLHPYPWPHMTACEGIVGGGMEYPMMTCVGDSPSARGLQGVIAHELIHMWFPMLVGSNEKRWSWMDEGLTSFFEILAGEDFWEDDREERMAFFTYMRLARTGRGLPCMRPTDSFLQGERMSYIFAAYTKPAAVFLQLRDMLGEGQLLEAFRTYVRSWAWKHPYPYDLFNTFKTVTGRDLDWYFRTWLYETWTLDQAVAEVELGEGATRVVVEDRGLATGPTLVTAEYEDGRTEEHEIPVSRWLSGKRRAVVKLPPGATKVKLHGDRFVLDADRSNDVWEAGG